MYNLAKSFFPDRVTESARLNHDQLLEDGSISAALDIAFNHKYLLDSLQSIKSDSISLSFAGIGKPLVVSGISDNTFMYLVMPMNR